MLGRFSCFEPEEKLVCAFKRSETHVHSAIGKMGGQDGCAPHTQSDSRAKFSSTNRGTHNKRNGVGTRTHL